jgi:hydrogenase nickel incorporation protein HypA/HybF
MHELSIAGSIAEVAERHAGGRRVLAVSIRAGQLRQVVPSALRFAFELVGSETPLAGASLQIEHVPVRGRCRTCGEHGELPRMPLACGACGGLELDLTSGEELEVVEIEVQQESGVEVEQKSGVEVQQEPASEREVTCT